MKKITKNIIYFKGLTAFLKTAKARCKPCYKGWARKDNKHMTITKYKLKKLLDKAKDLQEQLANFEDKIIRLNESVNELQKDLYEFEDKANQERNVTKW